MTSIDRRFGVSSGVAIKAPCRAVTTTAIDLNGEQTVGGTACVTGDRVLVAVDGGSVSNGIWVVDTGDWSRAADFDGNRDVVQGTVVLVGPGASSRFWQVQDDDPIVIGQGVITFLAIDPLGAELLARVLQRRNLRDLGLVADGDYATGAGTDNSALLQAGINALSQAGGGVLVDDGGVYKLASQIVWPDGVSFQGAGAGKWGTIFYCPTAFANTGGLFRISGVNGYPTCLSGFAVLAQTGGSGGAGIVSVKNGVFLSGIWVNGFTANHGVRLSNTDNFLHDFAIEQCLTGFVATECNINVSHGTLYDCTQGAVIANNASVEAGRVTLTGVRAVQCANDGFVVAAGKQVSLIGCSAAHVNAGKFSSSGVLIDTSSDVIITGFSAKLGSISTTATGIKMVNGASDVVITGPKISGFLDGISENGCSGVSITGGMSTGNGRSGMYLNGGDQISVTGVRCAVDGTAATSDAGIVSVNSAANAIHSLVGNICTQPGGGAQEYGIDASVTGTGTTSIIGNTCMFNNTADVRMTGSTGQIRYSDNIVGTVVDTSPSVASATALTLPSGADSIQVTGTTNITSITATGCARRTVTLTFAGVLTVTDGSNLKLAGNLVTTADDSITLYCDGTNWLEIARSVN